MPLFLGAECKARFKFEMTMQLLAVAVELLQLLSFISLIQDISNIEIPLTKFCILE